MPCQNVVNVATVERVEVPHHGRAELVACIPFISMVMAPSEKFAHPLELPRHWGRRVIIKTWIGRKKLINMTLISFQSGLIAIAATLAFSRHRYLKIFGLYSLSLRSYG
jgi:hypothetical protein